MSAESKDPYPVRATMPRQGPHLEDSVSVEDVGTVDFVGVDKRTGDVVLTVSDHLDWSDTVVHHQLLQRKLNTYLAFVESGEILENYPNSKDRRVVFEVVFKFRPDTEGEKFLARAKKVVEDAGFSLRWELFAASYDN